jgi:mono/diheme cytochrome c family protein
LQFVEREGLSCRFPARRILTATALVVFLGTAPVAPVVAAESAAARMERGHYLATAGNCTSCHTREGGQPFTGGLAFATPFGTLYSTNITPDVDTGIGKWSEQEFARAIRAGVRPNGEHLYPAFPYPAFTKLTDEDVAALFAYLRSLAPVKYAAPANELRFPFNQRWTLGMWKMLYFVEGRFTPDVARSAEWNRGAYLVEGLGHCGACHSPRNFLGAESSDLAMSGGEYSDKVAEGTVRSWSTPNLTAAPDGLRSWPIEDLAAYLKTGRNTFAETYGPMNEVIMNSTRHLSDADVHAMATYLKGLPGNKVKAPANANADVLQAGETLYNVHCGTCHLPTGLGGDAESSGARLAGNPVVQAGNPASLINIILYGPQLPNPPLPKRWKLMEGFGDKLADDEVAALASFLRSAWGNVGGAVSTDQVAKQR